MASKKKKKKWGVGGSVWESRKNLRNQRREKMKVVNHLPGGIVVTEDDYLGFQGQNVPPEPTHWETEDKMECIKDCGVAPEKKMVYISPLVYRKIKALMNKYKSREWLAYLIGKDEADAPGVFVADIYFPKQTATGVHVDDVVLSAKVKVIGVMHSHHGMGNRFSGTDHEYINDNHNVSILVSHKEITGQYRHVTPCKRYKIIPINVQVHYDINFDEETFIKEAEEKMNNRVTHVPPVYPTNRYSHGHLTPNQEVGAEATSMPKDEDIEKALEELDFERDAEGQIDASLVDEFEGVDVTEIEDTEAEEYMDECEDEDLVTTLAENMAKVGEVTVYDE